jgi:hypothetical protein
MLANLGQTHGQETATAERPDEKAIHPGDARPHRHRHSAVEQNRKGRSAQTAKRHHHINLEYPDGREKARELAWKWIDDLGGVTKTFGKPAESISGR